MNEPAEQAAQEPKSPSARPQAPVTPEQLADRILERQRVAVEEQQREEPLAAAEIPEGDHEPQAEDDEGEQLEVGDTEVEDSGDELEQPEAEDDAAPVTAAIDPAAEFTVADPETGEPITVTGQDLINDLHASRKFTANSQRQHAEHRERMAALNGEYQRVEAMREQHVIGLQHALNLKTAQRQSIEAMNLEALQAEDPAQYQRVVQQWQNLRNQEQQIYQGYQQLAEQAQQQKQQQQQQRVAESKELLSNHFGGEDKWIAQYPRLKTVATEFGYSEEEASNETDARFFLAMAEIAKLREELKPPALTPKRKAPTSKTKPKNTQGAGGLSTLNTLRAAEKAFRENRSPEAAGNYFEAKMKHERSKLRRKK